MNLSSPVMKTLILKNGSKYFRHEPIMKMSTIMCCRSLRDGSYSFHHDVKDIFHLLKTQFLYHFFSSLPLVLKREERPSFGEEVLSLSLTLDTL
jgi:hypothetical protein